jgi:hypothetical protein
VVGGGNPVAGPFFNLSSPEPTGVVAVLAPQESSLLGLVSVVAPVIATGNTAVVVASEKAPLPALSLGEVLATSDLPGGVVNVLSGRTAEIAAPLAAHQDVNAIDLAGADEALAKELEIAAADNLKRVLRPQPVDNWSADPGTDRMTAFLETKTVWHPTGSLGASGSAVYRTSAGRQGRRRSDHRNAADRRRLRHRPGHRPRVHRPEVRDLGADAVVERVHARAGQRVGLQPRHRARDGSGDRSRDRARHRARSGSRDPTGVTEQRSGVRGRGGRRAGAERHSGGREDGQGASGGRCPGCLVSGHRSATYRLRGVIGSVRSVVEV